LLGLGPQGKESLKGCLLLGQPQRACPYDVHRTCWVSGRVRGTVAQCPHRAHRANSLIPIIPQEHTVEHGGWGQGCMAQERQQPAAGEAADATRAAAVRRLVQVQRAHTCSSSFSIAASTSSPPAPPQQNMVARMARSAKVTFFGEFSSLLTVKTLTGMTTDVYPRENCIAPGELRFNGENNDNRHDNRCLRPPGELHSPGHCTHSMDHEHKEIDARARAEVAMGRDCCECSSFIFHALRYP
jgi:hypothetical protein